MEKFELLYSVLLSLHKAGVLADCVLVGSWCQDFYRHLWGNPFQIPAATTTDADLLVPKRMKFKPPADIAAVMQHCGFKLDFHVNGLMKFIHEDFTFEFLTEAGAKADETVFTFKNLNLTAQELHFMNIPLSYNFIMPFRDSLSVCLSRKPSLCTSSLSVSGGAKLKSGKKTWPRPAGCSSISQQKSTTASD